jgi:arginyl-tRNA synthetase
MTPLDQLRAAVEAAAADLRNGAPAPRAHASLERPKQAGFGDYSTNAAMLLAPALGAPPREIAERLGERLRDRLGDALDRVEVAGPGFLNVFLSDAWHIAAVRDMLAAGDRWGTSVPAKPEKVDVEFVSANPTGPLTAASGRHAAYGDAVSRLLEAAGNTVVREYYFNDTGSQVTRLGESVRARARHEPVPEDGYKGEYVAELAAEIPGAADGDPETLGVLAGELIMERIRASLAAYRVQFDVFFLEGSLHVGDPTPVDVAFARLRELGQVYESEGALWLRTSAFGDDKDRVLQRSTGAPTYFAADVAYHVNKLERGFDRMINVLGADHHGYIRRMKAALAALGIDPARFEVPMLQFVHIVEGGDRAKMSKRAGDFVTLDELIESIGVDATRWFMISRSHETTIDLDLDLARKQDPENPVYYVQYAHARTASIVRRAGEERVAAALTDATDGLVLAPAEGALIRKLLAFPGEVVEAADRRAPHRIATYALELSQALSAFYRDCHVLNAADEQVKSFRLSLCVVTEGTIARALALLGVSAPDSM